jgi:hypothetical protein
VKEFGRKIDEMNAESVISDPSAAPQNILILPHGLTQSINFMYEK